MFLFPLNVYLGVERHSHVLSVCLIFLEIVKRFSKVAILLYLLTSSEWEFWLFHIPPTHNIVSLFKYSHTIESAVDSHCDLIWILDDLQCWASFHVVIGHSHIYFVKHLFNFLFIFCWNYYGVVRVIFYQLYTLQIFSPCLQLIFFFNRVLKRESFQFWQNLSHLFLFGLRFLSSV